MIYSWEPGWSTPQNCCGAGKTWSGSPGSPATTRRAHCRKESCGPESAGVQDLHLASGRRASHPVPTIRIARIHALDTRIPCRVGPVWNVMDPQELIRWIIGSGRDIRLNLRTQSLIGADEAQRHWHKTV